MFSRQIKELEEFFGAELIRRQGRGIALERLEGRGPLDPGQGCGLVDPVEENIYHMSGARQKKFEIRVLPRENPGGNRLALRRDIGHHYKLAETLLAQ